MDALQELDPGFRARIEAELVAADKAARLFRQQPGCKRILIRLAGKIEQLRHISHLEFQSAARAKIVVKWFDCQAKAWLSLVTSQELLKAYEDFLTVRRKVAWHEFTGHPPEDLPAIGKHLVAIQETLYDHERKWVTKARKQIATHPEIDMNRKQQKTRRGADTVATERQELISEFKAKARTQNIKVTDAMVAKAAYRTWNDRTMVTWWKRNAPRSQSYHDKAIRAVLAKDPASIWASNVKPKKRSS